LERGYGGRRYKTWVFTEQGVAMLSSVLRPAQRHRRPRQHRNHARLRSPSARRARQRATHGPDRDLSKRVDVHDQVIADLVDSIRALVEAPASKPSRPIGFTADLDK
jgi:hypothetical protein